MDTPRIRSTALGRRAFLLTMLTWGGPVCVAAQGFPGGVGDVLGPRFGTGRRPADLRQRRRRRRPGALESLRHWNEVALDATGLDHTPTTPGERRVFGEQFGPGRSSRAMAIVHIAVFDAMNAIIGGYQSYTDPRVAPPATSIEAAVALAAHDTLVASSLRRRTNSTTFSSTISERFAKAARRQTASRSAERWPARSWRVAPATGRSSPNLASGSISSRATSLANGDRIR